MHTGPRPARFPQQTSLNEWSVNPSVHRGPGAADSVSVLSLTSGRSQSGRERVRGAKGRHLRVGSAMLNTSFRCPEGGQSDAGLFRPLYTGWVTPEKPHVVIEQKSWGPLRVLLRPWKASGLWTEVVFPAVYLYKEVLGLGLAGKWRFPEVHVGVAFSGLKGGDSAPLTTRSQPPCFL